MSLTVLSALRLLSAHSLSNQPETLQCPVNQTLTVSGGLFYYKYSAPLKLIKTMEEALALKLSSPFSE